MRIPQLVAAVGLSLVLIPCCAARGELRVGAAIVDVTPKTLPVLVNGGMLSRSVDTVNTRVNARAIALEDGDTRAAIVIVDSCMMPRPLLDDAKKLASQRTKIAPDRILIGATHTHSAPSSLACLGTNADPTYVPYLREKLAEAVAKAEANLEPAEVGFGSIDAAEFTALRRWIRRPDRVAVDPFGNPTMRAQMHSGRNWDDVVGESGPEDPELSLIAFRSLQGRPIAVLANFSMHYFGDRALSADYFGLFCGHLETSMGDPKSDRPFMAALSHGCSGDIWRRDYRIAADKRNDSIKIDDYATQLGDLAIRAMQSVKYQRDADLAMDEARFVLNYRTPDAQLLQWAEKIVTEMGDRPPKTQTEVYAREQVILHERQTTEVVVQALRIGDIGIATTPNETYALTGLKIKLQSPTRHTMVIELANGGDGYIPPPEQHLLGGYNTWPARSAGLEVLAEPRIAEACVSLLERVTGQPRKRWTQSRGEAASAVLELDPQSYWRLDEWAGPTAKDSSKHANDAVFEPQIAYFLEGPRSDSFCRPGDVNRSAHFAGGRMRSRLAGLGDKYSVSIWFWNGLPDNARETAGWMFSRGDDFSLDAVGDHLGLRGDGAVLFESRDASGKRTEASSQTTISRWTWGHVVLVRDGERVKVYVNGGEEPEIDTEASSAAITAIPHCFIGGRCDRVANWEGRLDEVAVFARPLTSKEAKQLYVKSVGK